MPGVPRLDGTFMTIDGLALSTWRTPALAKSRGAVILVHGLSDHSRSEPYARLGAALAEQGFEVFAFDRRGSGLSPGPANYAPSWAVLRDDLGRFVDLVEDQCGRLPALVGLSFGGLQTLDFALHQPQSLRAAVLMAPALDVSGASPFLRRILPLLAALAPRLNVDPGLSDDFLCRDVEMRRRYRDDPRWRAKTTPALAAAALETIDRLRRHAAQVETPLLAFHGTADRVVPIGGTRDVFPRFGAEDKTLIEFEGAYHALPLEAEGERMAAQMGSWLAARLGA